MGTETIHGVDLEVLRTGAGAPLVLLHGFQQIDPDARFCDCCRNDPRSSPPPAPASDAPRGRKTSRPSTTS